MSPYRDDLEAVRRRVDALEAEIALRDGALRECEAELAQCRAELARARDEGPRGGAMPLALVAFVGALGSVVLTMPVDGARCRAERASANAWLEGASISAAEPARAFDRALAETLLETKAQEASVCERPGGPSGEGRAVLTFAGNGAVDSIALFGDPVADSPSRACLEGVYQSIRLPPFLGPPVTVSGHFSLRPWELDLSE
ncbi:MAG: hypothetical protein MUF34_20275 [Polyangiaceae bacterium]|nr:hypothetical protein [Polyangiaceae bacterium]